MHLWFGCYHCTLASISQVLLLTQPGLIVFKRLITGVKALQQTCVMVQSVSVVQVLRTGTIRSKDEDSEALCKKRLTCSSSLAE